MIRRYLVDGDHPVLQSGLSADEAKRRPIEYGPDDPAPTRRRSVLARFFCGRSSSCPRTIDRIKDLFVQQAALTGESVPVEKQVSPDKNPTDEPNSPYMVFLGTSVVSGSALAVVSATGSHTVFGGIASRLADRPQETEFERSFRKFGLLIMRVVLFLVIFLITVSIAFHHDPFQSVIFAIALAVGLTPEFLPMITSVTLANSRPLAITVLVVVAAGLAIPFTPLAPILGFTPFPLTFFVFLLLVTVTYLAVVELAKLRLFSRFHLKRVALSAASIDARAAI